jgi:hypothetical protein
MAVDGLARALAFAAASADDVSGLQQDVAKVQASLETTKQEINTTLENTTNELNATLETTTNELNATLEATKTEINAELEATVAELNSDLEEKRVKIFDSNVVKYEELSEEERMSFDIAIVAPAVNLTNEQLASINTMVGDETETVVNMSAEELNNQLDNIISGE